jgi:predicted nucleic acid-binding protein
VKKYLLDTNVLLRFLLDDHPELSRAAARLFQQAADEKCLLILTDLGIAEAVWVLTSYYKIERQKVAESLAKLLLKAGVQCPTLEPVLDALARFKATNCDFFDCYLAAQAANSGVAIASFDKDLRKFEDASLWDAEAEMREG